MVRTVTYAFEEALRSLWKGRRSSAFSIVTIASALLVLGAFLLLTSNLERLVATWGTTAEMSVFLEDSITEEEREAIDRAIRESGLSREHDYVTKAEARERFSRDFPDLAPVSAALPDNPFPASFELRLATTEGGGADVERLASRLQQAGGVADVQYDRRWLDRLVLLVRITEGLALAFGAILVVAAALTVANVVRLAGHLRRDEIHIMRLVGAPPGYIRGPFVVEGILQGLIGGILSLLFLALTYFVFGRTYGEVSAQVLGVGAVTFLPASLAAMLVLGGVVVGCAGGLLATGRGQPGGV